MPIHFPAICDAITNSHGLKCRSDTLNPHHALVPTEGEEKENEEEEKGEELRSTELR